VDFLVPHVGSVQHTVSDNSSNRQGVLLPINYARPRSERQNESAPETGALPKFVRASGSDLGRLDLQKLAGARDWDRPRLHHDRSSASEVHAAHASIGTARHRWALPLRQLGNHRLGGDQQTRDGSRVPAARSARLWSGASSTCL